MRFPRIAKGETNRAGPVFVAANRPVRVEGRPVDAVIFVRHANPGIIDCSWQPPRVACRNSGAFVAGTQTPTADKPRVGLGLAADDCKRPFVLFIALVPGFVEETFFRGYMPRRLLQRWSPAVGILVTTALFAIMHITPHAVVNAFVIGLWLGVLAWRTGSVWPGVVSHAFINGSWNIWQIGKVLGVFPRTPHVTVTATLCAVVLGCFLASVWLLARKR